MLTRRQEAVYLMQVVKLRKLMVLKDNPAFTYQHTNRRKAITNIHNLQNKIVEATVTNQVYGNTDNVDYQKNVEQTIHDTLENDRKRVYKVDDNRYINTAVKLNTQKYSEILNNRLNIESVKLETKIEEEIRKSKYHGLSEVAIKEKLMGEFKDTAKLRTANIIRDALHTNEANISWIHALENEFQYKVWNNGRGKGKVRTWHRARFISSVPIDEPFDIFGSYHAEMMYPGDLNGGAENVANCKCWLRYTNSKPSNLRRKATGIGSYSKSTQNNGASKKNTKKDKDKSSKSRISSTLKNIKNSITSKTRSIINKIKGNKNNQFKDSFHKIDTNKNEVIITKEDHLRRKKELTKILDNEDVNVIYKEIKRFEKIHALSKVEYLRLHNKKGKPVLKNRTDHKENYVNIPDQILRENKEGFLLSFHNHPSGNPTPSIADINTTINRNINYSFIVGRHRGIFIIKYEETTIIDEETLGNCLDNIKNKRKKLYKHYDEYEVQIRKEYKRGRYYYFEYLDKVNNMLDSEFKKNNEEMIKFINKEFKNNNINVEVFYLR